MPTLWTLAGLSLPELVRRTLLESWRDDVFGQGGRMAFYQFLAIFPSLLIAFTIVTHIPHLSGHLKDSLRDVSGQLFPARVSQLFQQMLTNFSTRPRFGLRLLSVCAAAIWAAHNGTWAMIYGLNRAYEVEERRSWWQLTVTIIALTACLAAVACLALLLIFSSAFLEAHLYGSFLFLRALEWIALALSLSIVFVLLYRFAPNLRPHALRWSTPGALCALLLWLAATFAAHLYFDHINDYSRSYGPLNGVVMLLLWLYASNGALLIGGEMNSEIQKAESGRADSPHSHA
ncbi:MAG TPA: YihY/virulence factor BrkB family protein [Acidobacteriaceae bacterium]|jgi:membrane protein|nr:YihY/virulence factor BrkB family protein [Acidobacteriaceae bacterium]